jgi:hypothetical protein
MPPEDQPEDLEVPELESDDDDLDVLLAQYGEIADSLDIR